VPGRQGVAREPELGVDFGEARQDVGVAFVELRRVLAHDLAHLLVDGDRLQREALRRVILSDAFVRRDRVAVGVHARLKVTDLEERTGVVRIVVNDPLVLFNGPVEALFLDVLLGALKNSLSIDGHADSGRSCSTRALNPTRSRMVSSRNAPWGGAFVRAACGQRAHKVSPLTGRRKTREREGSKGLEPREG